MVFVLLVVAVAVNWLMCVGCCCWLLLAGVVVLLLVIGGVVIWLMCIGCWCCVSLVVFVGFVGWLLLL